MTVRECVRSRVPTSPLNTWRTGPLVSADGHVRGCVHGHLGLFSFFQLTTTTSIPPTRGRCAQTPRYLGREVFSPLPSPPPLPTTATSHSNFPPINTSNRKLLSSQTVRLLLLVLLLPTLLSSSVRHKPPCSCRRPI